MSSARRFSRLAGLLAGIVVGLGGAALLAQDPAMSENTTYLGSKATKVFHKTTCAAVKKVSAKNRVTFASADEATTQDFTPCPICKPTGAEATGGEMAADKAEGAMPKPKGKKALGKAAMKKAEAAKKAETSATATPPADDGALKFSVDIAPILAANCMGCHNPQQKRGQFVLSTFEKLMEGSAKEKVIAPGKPDESELVLRIKNESASGRKMPPGQANLSAEAIAKIEQWIKSGARLNAGIEPTANLDAIAPTPEARRRAEMAKLTPEARDKKLEEVALERWKKASSKTVPKTTQGKNFILFSNLPAARADRLLKTMEAQRTALGTLLGPASATSLSGPEKISLYVFNDLASYVEFVRSVENRELESGVDTNGKLNVEAPYLAAADPLVGRDEPAGSMSPKASSKKAGKAKKATQDDIADGPERSLAGLLSESMASSAITASGKPPRWLSAGLGAFLSSNVDPSSSGYYRKLREEAAAQYQIGWAAKAPEALGDQGAPETIRAIGFSLCEWLATSQKAYFSPFIRNMLQGGEKLDETVHACFGAETTRDQFLAEWGGFVAARYGGRRR